jgi:hypothetical protein
MLKIIYRKSAIFIFIHIHPTTYRGQYIKTKLYKWVNTMHYQISFNALFPPAMVAKGEDLGLKKANTKALNLFLHATSTGVFIGIEQW